MAGVLWHAYIIIRREDCAAEEVLSILGALTDETPHTLGQNETLILEVNKRKKNAKRSQPQPRHQPPSRGRGNIQTHLDVSRSHHFPSLPQPHDRNGDAPRVSRRASIRQLVALDRKVQRNVERAGLKEPKSHAVQVFSRQLCDIARNLAPGVVSVCSSHSVEIDRL